MAQGTPTAQAIQAAIGQVKGIIANRVVLQGGHISEVHILAEAGRQPKQIVRDVESLCAAEFGIRIDHRRVSVVQIEAPGVKRETPRPRPVIHGVRVESEGTGVVVHVTLAVGEHRYKGEADGLNVNRHRVAATATLRALEEYMRGSCRFVLDDLVPFHLGGWNGFLVGVVMISNFGEERLVGSALVKKDALDAVIRATCDAVNRRIGAVRVGG